MNYFLGYLDIIYHKHLTDASQDNIHKQTAACIDLKPQCDELQDYKILFVQKTAILL